MPFWSRDQDRSASIDLLNRFTTDERKNAVFSGLLEGLLQIGTDRKEIDATFVSDVWTMLTREPAPWQLEPILMCYGMTDLFGQHIKLETIDQLIEVSANNTRSAGLALARAPTRYQLLSSQLKESGRTLEYLERVREVAPSAWQSYASNLYRNENVVGALSKPEERSKLLDLVGKESESIRYAHLIGLIDNKKFLSALIGDGQYDRLFGLFPSNRFAYQRAQLIGRLLSKQTVVDFLIKEDRIEDLLVFNQQGQSENDKRLILTNLPIVTQQSKQS